MKPYFPMPNTLNFELRLKWVMYTYLVIVPFGT